MRIIINLKSKKELMDCYRTINHPNKFQKGKRIQKYKKVKGKKYKSELK